MVASGQTPHRVIEKFCGTSPGTLRSDFIAHSNGSAMSARLRLELTSYQLAVIDDSYSESPHAAIGKIVEANPGSKEPYWCASFRLKQNIDAMRRLEVKLPGVFSHCFLNWKFLCPIDHLPLWHPRKLTRREVRLPVVTFIEKTYKVGEYSYKDLSLFEEALVDVKDTQSQRRAPQCSTIKVLKSYLECILALHSFWSVSTDAPPDIDGENGAVATSQGTCVFSALDVRISQKSYVQCEDVSSMLQMKIPVLVQFYQVVDHSLSHCSDSLTLLPDGRPLVYDIINLLTPMRERVQSLKFWAVCKGNGLRDSPTVLSQSSLASSMTWFSQLPFPMLHKISFFIKIYIFSI